MIRSSEVRWQRRLAVSSVVVLLCAATLHAQGYDRKESPFDDARFVGPQAAKIEVLIDGTWYEPLAIDGTPVDDILSFCESRWPLADKRRRFLQDLIEALALMDREPDLTVDLTVRTLPQDGPVRELELTDVPLSRERRLKFSHDPQWIEFFQGTADRAKTHIELQAALADLELFRIGLQERFAYLHRKGVDLSKEVEAASRDITNATTDRGVSIAWLRRRLDRILMRFGDGHAGVRTLAGDIATGGFMPYLMIATGQGVAAVKHDRTALLDAEHPYVVEIDGEPLSVWLDRVKPTVVDGSRQLVRELSLWRLQQLASIRAHHAMEVSSNVTVGLGRTPASVDQRLSLELQSRPPAYGTWPQRETQSLQGDIGYLRLRRMTPETAPVHDAMARFRETRGLIVDVRGNGGGSRHALRAFAGYLQGPDEPPWIGNVATYKRSLDREEGHLDSRFLLRRDDFRLTKAQRTAIDEFRQRFEPEWRPEDPVGGRFSEWHYLVLGRTGDEREYFYDRPVVVLSDAGSFSATDIFLGALRGRPRVTLLCQNSGGGSAGSHRFTLPNSRLVVRSASMASFQPNGQLYDGNGVQVDIEVAQPPTDFILGGTDRCLEEALRRFE